MSIRLSTVLIIFVSLLLFGCKISDDNLIIQSDDYVPLPDEFFLVGVEPEFFGEEAETTVTGITRRLSPNQFVDQSEQEISFQSLPEHDGYWVMQFSVNTLSYLSLVEIDGNTATLFFIDTREDKEIRDQLSEFPDLATKITSSDQIEPYFNLAMSYDLNIFDRATYYIFDASVVSPEDTAVTDLIDSLNENFDERMQQRAQQQEQLEDARLRLESEKRFSNNGVAYGRWLHLIEKDVVTDEIRQALLGLPNGFDDFQTSPIMSIVCRHSDAGHLFEISIHWKDTLQNILTTDEDISVSRVIMRFDENPAEETGWGLGNNGQSSFPLHNISDYSVTHLNRLSEQYGLKVTVISEFLRNDLLDSEQAIFRSYRAANGEPLTLIFDMSGYSDALQNFPSQCR